MAQPHGQTQAPGFYRFRIGDAAGIAVHDGVLAFDRPPGFVRGVADDAVGDAFAEAGMPHDRVTLTFTALLLEIGDRVVLIDTGWGAGGPPGTGLLADNLRAAGFSAEAVTDVVISHFHVDHISGLRRQDGSDGYPRARVHVPQPEWDAWFDPARRAAASDSQRDDFALVDRVLGPASDTVRRFAWGDEVVPGITALPVPGHTPGMTAYRIASGGETLTYVADITNNPLLFARYPDWQVIFDADGDAAVATRRRMLDAAAQERGRLFFFHAPFPGVGTVVRSGDGFAYLPALWTAG